MDTEKLARRREAIMRFLGDEAPYTMTDQKHLEVNTPERAYWHLGYAAALADVMRLSNEPNAEDPKAL